MANWDSYTQKTTPADADTLMIKDTAGGANKRTPFSGVWNWIVGKLTSAVISQLETTNKSIVPAINELNSKIYAKVLAHYVNTGANTIKFANISDCNQGMIFVVFNAGGSSMQSSILYSYSHIDNYSSLTELINKNQQAEGYKIESVGLIDNDIQIQIGKYGGYLSVLYIGT